MRDWSRFTVVLLAALMVTAGAIRVAQSGTAEGYALLAAGLVLVGVGVALELHDRWHGDR